MGESREESIDGRKGDGQRQIESYSMSYALHDCCCFVSIVMSWVDLISRK